jgi:hypothetical protein
MRRPLALLAPVAALCLAACPGEPPATIERSVSKEQRDLDAIQQAVEQAAARVTEDNANAELDALEAELERERQEPGDS